MEGDGPIGGGGVGGRRQVLMLVLFCSVYISWGLTDSIQAPFYPIEAEAKGADISEYGFVFGVIHLVRFVLDWEYSF